MTVNTVEFRDIQKRFVFHGGSPYAIAIADEIDKLHAENERLRRIVKNEREACARIAEEVASRLEPGAGKFYVGSVADFIRNRGRV